MPGYVAYDNFKFQTQIVARSQTYILFNLKKYFSILIQNKETFRLAFQSMMARLMEICPQKFTLHFNEAYKVRSQLYSTFIQATQGQPDLILEQHISQLIKRVKYYNRSSFYIALSHKKQSKTKKMIIIMIDIIERQIDFLVVDRHYNQELICENSSYQQQCFDSIMLRWDNEDKQYDLKSIEWDLQNHSQKQKQMRRVNRAIQTQQRMQTKQKIRRQHFIVCPQTVVDILKADKDISSLLVDETNKWKITLITIEDVRFTGFTYNDCNLKPAVDQLFEHFTIAKTKND